MHIYIYMYMHIYICIYIYTHIPLISPPFFSIPKKILKNGLLVCRCNEDGLLREVPCHAAVVRPILCFYLEKEYLNELFISMISPAMLFVQWWQLEAQKPSKTIKNLDFYRVHMRPCKCFDNLSYSTRRAPKKLDSASPVGRGTSKSWMTFWWKPPRNALFGLLVC